VIVLDASAAIDWLLRTKAGQRIEERIYARNESLHAPYLLDLEVTQVLRRMVYRREIPDWRADEAITDLLRLRVVLYPHRPLVRRIWQMRQNLTAYDAAYVALAEKLNATLITLDARLASASGHQANIEFF
jgi:predicted nucleic acid-binding protein